MRGRTLNDSFVILDEAQNTTGEQMKMFLTRMGFNSKAVITGDVTQIDLPERPPQRFADRHRRAARHSRYQLRLLQRKRRRAPLSRAAHHPRLRTVRPVERHGLALPFEPCPVRPSRRKARAEPNLNFPSKTFVSIFRTTAYVPFQRFFLRRRRSIQPRCWQQRVGFGVGSADQSPAQRPRRLGRGAEVPR